MTGSVIGVGCLQLHIRFAAQVSRDPLGGQQSSMKANSRRLVAICTFLVGLGLSCPTESDFPRLHDQMPCSQSDTLWAIAAAQTARGCEVVRGGVKFFVGTIDGKTIAFVSTRDIQFHSPEGIQVGHTHQNVLNAGGSNVSVEPSWGYYSHLPSGWNAKYGGVPGVESVGGIAITRDSVIQELFLRD